jgi:uncharacterized glyoxalase superfamily protein PhnB
MRVITYLYFKGQCEAAFRFYEASLGGKIETMLSHTGTPAAEHVPREWRNKILHAQLALGDTILLGSDAPPDRYHPGTPNLSRSHSFAAFSAGPRSRSARGFGCPHRETVRRGSR